MLGVALDEKQDTDYVEKHDGYTFVVDQELIDRFKGFEIDFTMNWFSKGFVVRPSFGTASSC